MSDWAEEQEEAIAYEKEVGLYGRDEVEPED